MNDNYTLILRTVGERTENLCRQLILDQVPECNIHQIEEKPFWKSLVASYELGIAANREYTLCIDADILFFSNAIHDMTRELQQLPPSTFGITGKYYDKFFNRPKLRGVHLYKTEFLHKALSFASVSGGQIRPETFTKDRMKDEGFDWKSSNTLFGIHDFGQYYRDIFRKLIVGFIRNSELTLIFQDIDRFSKWDKDFLVASWGVRYGRDCHRSNLPLDSDYWDPIANAVLRKNGLIEKSALVVSDIEGVKKRIHMLKWIQKYKIRRLYPKITTIIFKNVL